MTGRTRAATLMDAHHELEKLQSYLTEVRAQWAGSPERVVGRAFYELWEGVRQPRPFVVDADHLVLAGESFALLDGVGAVARVCWDTDEACVAVAVEGKTARQRFLLVFQDGEAVVTEAPVVLRESQELSFGERLELIYDVIAWCRQNRPTLDVLNCGRADYDSALRALAPNYQPAAVKMMRRLRLRDVRKLIGRAVQDMAVDELSDQLMLPLDGTYAATDDRPAPTADADAPDAFRLVLPTRTVWEVTQELDFIREAAEARARMEARFILTFDHHEVLCRPDPRRFVIRLPVDRQMPLQEGDRLRVFRHGENRYCAEFNLDVHDGDHVIGRLNWSEAPAGDALPDDLYVKPRRGPAEFLAGELTALYENFRRERGLESPVLAAALGIGEHTIADRGRGAVADHAGMDSSQMRAARNATASDSAVVLIQGPPGTGKTHVLERVIRKLVGDHRRILMTAPSNAAVDNLCRRLVDLPVLRLGRDSRAIAPDVQERCWIGRQEVVRAFTGKRAGRGSVYCGTHVGVLRDELVRADQEQNGLYDAVVFDEAGMSRLEEFLLCARLGARAVLFGDHRQLPPFPLSAAVIDHLQTRGVATEHQWAAVNTSALEWLADERGLPIYLLHASYRCQNPRLMRFASTLFYDARVKTSRLAEYYRLSFAERQSRFPPSTLQFHTTSDLPPEWRVERLVLEGNRPGIENELEARVTVGLVYRMLQSYPLREISVISPYRRQVRLIREALSAARVAAITGRQISGPQWKAFLLSRIATVDSFQGGESDVVIISYVRSNTGETIGFVDDANRVNVAHTRCRREMHVIGDLECLKKAAGNRIFERMERAIARDGEIVSVTPSDWPELELLPPAEPGGSVA